MLQLTSRNLEKSTVENWIVPVCEDARIHENASVLSFIEKMGPFDEFAGKPEDEFILYEPGIGPARRVLLFGIGKQEDLNPESFRDMAGKAVKKCIRNRLKEALLVLPPPEKAPIPFDRMLTAAMEGACLGNHLFDAYKREKKLFPLKKIHVFIGSASPRKYNPAAYRTATICSQTLTAREWVSTPANDKRPEAFARDILNKARKAGLKSTVMDDKILKKEGFGAILAVAAGSTSKPRMIILEYRAPKADKTLALVGKGVTFDSGGLNLKPSGSIEDMKSDMAGAATVAATLIAAAGLEPAINVVGVIPLVENMPSGGASRPGDIIRTYEGKTVEIGNTDAEGRLILIDALAWAVKTYHPDALIDVATLTGACAVALGEKIAGVFSFDDELAGRIITSGDNTHERCWRMPMPKDYKELLKSEFADIHNMSSSRFGGAIAAALFLSEFVGDARWAHIDIAGPAYAKKATDYCNAGGTGFGVRMLCDLLGNL
ncbi:MAG: leucyl aminopeptidase [Desulfobacterales bacterium]